MGIEERLSRLERENRRLRLLVFGLIGAALCCWLAGFPSVGRLDAEDAQAGRVVAASEFRVVDGNGKVRGRLGVEERSGLLQGAVCLDLFDGNGKIRWAGGVDKDGPRVILCDENEKPRWTGIVAKDGPSLILADENEKPRWSVIVTKDGPILDLSDENNKTLLSAGAYKDIGPSLSLYDGKAKLPRWSVMVTKDGPSLSLADEKGQDRAVLGVVGTKTKAGVTMNYPENTLTLFDAEGHVLHQAP